MKLSLDVMFAAMIFYEIVYTDVSALNATIKKVLVIQDVKLFLKLINIIQEEQVSR